MTNDEIIKALSNLKVETGSLICLGCGHEHNCSTHGCAIINAAVDALSTLVWVDPALELPPEDAGVLAVVSGRPETNLTLEDAYEIAFYSENEGWIIDAYPGWENAEVKMWMHIPEVSYEA